MKVIIGILIVIILGLGYKQFTQRVEIIQQSYIIELRNGEIADLRDKIRGQQIELNSRDSIIQDMDGTIKNQDRMIKLLGGK